MRRALPRRLSLAAAALAALVVLAGCNFGLEPTITLITDRPEMAAYVDIFNALHTDARVELTYAETPSQAVLNGAAGDLVIGSWLSSPAVMDRLDSLADIVKPGKLDPSWFYQGLLAMGSRDNRPFLVPLSFSLPAVVFVPARLLPTELPPMFMPLDTLRSLSGPFNKKDKAGNYLAMGFSPSWFGDFLTGTALLFKTRFRAGRGGLPAWDDAGLKKTVDFTRSWLAEVNGGGAADRAFADRALVQPWYKLLTSQKIRFALASFTDLFALPEDKRHDFGYRWLSQDGLVPVMDDALFGGVLRNARNKAGARTFLLWFSSPAVQQSLLSANQAKRIGVFAVTNGFSALKAINEKDLRQRYPELLLGHLPLESFLVFPDALPDNWITTRGVPAAGGGISTTDGVIWPWILASARDSAVKPLDKTLQDWQNEQKK